MNSKLKAVAKIIVSVALLGLLLALSGPEKVAETIIGSNIWQLAIAFCFILLGTFIAAYRWFTVMRILEFRGGVGFYIKSYLKGVFFNQLLPSSIGGDAVRVLDVAKLGYRKRDAFVGVLIDRGLGIVGIFIVNIIFNNALPGLLPDSIYRMLNIVSALGIAGFIAFAFINKINSLSRYKLFAVVMKPSLALHKVMSGFRRSFVQIIMTVAVHMLTFAGVYYISLAIGLELPISVFMVIMPPVILLTIIPISLAGWGIREGAMIGLLSFAGVSKELALSLSILYGFSYIPIGVVGMYFWVRFKKGEENLT